MNKNIIISNPIKFDEIKTQIKLGGYKNLHVVSDFNRTLTKAYTKNTDLVPSLISILRDENYLIKGYSEKAKDLFKKYHPIEINNNFSIIEKKKAMEQWWEKHSKLLIKSGLNKKDLIKVAQSNRINFREKFKESILVLNSQKVPFIILSASGLGDESIIETLKFKNLNLDNICVISNKYTFDKKGFAISFKKPQIHVFNKNETSLKNSQVYEKIKNRKNVILLGDSLGDVKMIQEFECDNLLKIGFLNFNIDDDLEEYKKNYDVIILNDSSMDFFYNFLKELK